ncbi:MAG: TauD/TfdA family dioxygenase [Candidatus Melainabacteria bacterium]|nr:TauD/TfdA family dioxygenase [Candidatus Melainabacteria bacterium]
MPQPPNDLSKMFIPDECRFTPSRGFEVDAYRRAVLDNGIALISFENKADADGTVMKKIVDRLGIAAVHDRDGTSVWDVKYDESVDQENGTRSLTTKEFRLHTDGSFEVPPPTFVALYCVEPDQLGGGETLFVDGNKIRPLLSPATLKVLLEHDFEIKVPEEFFKGHNSVMARVLNARGSFRFRKDLLKLDNCAPHLVQAVEELDQLINSDSQTKGIQLSKGQMVIFDNARFFHGRRKIEDQRRHLKRMWFHI